MTKITRATTHAARKAADTAAPADETVSLSAAADASEARPQFEEVVSTTSQ